MDKGLENWKAFMERREAELDQDEVTAVNRTITEAEVVETEESPGYDPYNTGAHRLKWPGDKGAER